MDNNTEHQAAEILAQQDPVAFINSNPTPRDWDMTPEDINRSLRFNPHELVEAATTIETREGPEKHGFLRTLWDQTLNGIVSGMESVGGQALAYSTAYTSPNMSREEAERILEDALYNDSLYRNAVQYERTKHVGNDFAAGLGNAIGSMITLVGVGAVTGSPALVSMVAGAQAAAEMKGQLVDEYVSKFGDTEGYAEESAKDSAIATGYGIFTGITETLLGVEKLATGAINRTTRADAYARLLRQQGKLSASKWVKTGSRLARSAIEEGAEEFVQSLAETEAASWASYTKQLSDSQELKQALTATMYGALVGGPVGMGLYRYNRKTVIDRISEWADKNKINLTAQQKVQIADDMLDNGRRQMVDEIATRAEIKNKYGQAFDLLKTRIKDLFINSTSKPWERLGQDIDQYVEDVAYTVTLPAVLLANKAHLPLSEFLDVVNLRVIRNKLHFTPLESADQLRAMLKQQEGIIREERRKAGLGIGDGARLQAAQRRKLILQDAIAEMTKADNAEHEARRRSYAQKDYIKAQELLPEQTTTIDQAQEAAENEEYVLFGQKRIPVTYEVVELDSIQPSHINGTPNPNYTNKELQNRASRGTTQDVADLRGKATNITPGRLLTSYTSSEGAPVINAQGEVIAGNGRTEIVRFAYENPETAKQYRDALENAGFSTEGMTRPILVRRNTTMTPEEQVAAADLSNISETSAFDTASRAKRDTQYLPGTTTPLEFAAKLPMSERRGLMMNNGKWNMRAVRQRYEEAVLAWVCGNDARLFEALVLDGKLTQKTISTITANAALLIETETAHPDAGIRQDLYNALVKMQNTTRQNFIEMTQQPTLTGQNPMAENMLVWNFLYTDTQTSQQYLHNYIQTIADNRNAVAQGGGLLGEPVAPLSKKDALMQALQATDEARRQASLDRGVEYKSIFTEDGQITTPELNAAVLSYKNELTGLTGTAANDQILEMLDLANEMAELDDKYAPYDGETIVVNGVERPTKNSDGQPIAKSEPALRNFWNWFGDSKAVDEGGRPLVVYHGTTKKFNTFDINKADEGSDLGAGFYFTNNIQDLEQNYEGGGADFESRVNNAAVKLQQEEGISDWEEAYQKAYNQEYQGDFRHPVYLKTNNPFVIGGPNETVLTFKQTNNEKPTGTLVEFAYALDSELGNKGPISDTLFEYARQNNGQLSASEIYNIVKEEVSPKFANYDTDKTGNILANAVKKTFDAFIDTTVSSKFKHMNLSGDTAHYVVFDSNQVARTEPENDLYEKDTINVDGVERTVYNSKGDRIAKSAESLKKFWRWFGDSKVVDEQGRPLVVYHGTPNGNFDEFRIQEGYGVFTTDNQFAAKEYSEKNRFFDAPKTGMVYAVYMKLLNPKIVDYEAATWEGIDERTQEKKFLGTDQEVLTTDRNKFDGVIIQNVQDWGGGEVINEYIAFEPNQIKATNNNGEWSRTSNNIYEQLAFVSGSAMYERPSTLYVLRGGEGAIVHGWGVYLQADQLKNVENYRKKFSRNYVFVRNFPEIKPLNGTGDLDSKEAELFDMFKSHFKSPYNINTIADLLQDDLVPLSPEAKLFLDIQTSRQDSKYVVRKEFVRGQAHRVYYTLKAPRNAHPWVKSFVKKINAKVEQRVKAGITWDIPNIIGEMLKSDRGADFDQFLRDMFDKSETYKDYSKAFVDKAIRFINARLSSDEYGIVEVEEAAPVFSPWPQLSPMDAQRVIEDLQEIQTEALTDNTIRPELRAFRDAQRVILLHAILQLESVIRPTLYTADRNLLNMLLTSNQTIDSALKDRPELSNFMRKVLKLARESREEVIKNHPNIGEMDPVEHIGSSIDFMQPEELDQYLSAIYPDITNPANPAAEFLQRTSKIMREEVAKMLKSGRLEIEYKTDNLKLFKDTDPTVIDAKAPKVLQIMVRAMRNMVNKKPFDEIIYSNPETYRGLVGLLGFIDSVAVNPSVENVIRMLLIPNNTLHLGNLENIESWKKVVSLDSTKTSHTSFLVMLLDDAKKIFDQNRTGPDNAKTDSWMALAQAIQNMEPKTKQMFQDAILDQEIGTKPEHADLIMEMILHPEWVKHTLAQQLAVEIPENDQLLDQDKPLAEQAAAPILREFLTNELPGWGWGLLEEVDQSKYPEFRKAYNLPQERLRDLVDQAQSDMFDGVKDSKATKLAVAYIMQNMTGEGLWHSIADNLPEMSVELKNGEEIGEEKYDLYDPDENKTHYIMGRYYTAELARDVSMWLKDVGFQGITYHGGIDGRGFVIFSDEAMEVLQRIDDEKPIYYQGGSKTPGGWYDAELDVIVMTKTMNETTFVHEMHHRYLDKIFALYKAAKAGQKTVAPEWIAEIDELFQMLEIDPNQPKLEAHQQEKFARMVEAYITGLGVEDPTNLAFKAFLNWVPERYRSVSDLAYLDKNGQIVNPMLDEQSIKFFNRWFGNPALPSLATAPDAMRMVNPTDADDKIIPSSQKEMNNREKEWGQDSEEQNKADAQLWRAIGENTPGDTRAAMDAEEVRMKAQATNLPDDRELPAKPTMRDRWFKTGQKDARTIAAEKAREYVAKNPEHARELAFTDPELETVYDAPVDRGMLIRAVMETVQKGSDEWYLLDHNLAIVKSMSGSTLSLSGDQSHQAYLDALREVENARELKAAANYAGSTTGALETWNTDIRAFVAKRVAGIMNTQPDSEERKVAIKAFLEEARTKFSANTTGIFEQMDLTPYQTQNRQVFIKWAEKQIRKQAGAKLNTKEQAELMQASIKAQVALTEIDSLNPDRAAQAGKDLRHWQFVKDKMKKANYGRWGKFGLLIDNMFGSYAPAAMLMSMNTLFVANIPSTAINTGIVRAAATGISKNVVSKHLQDAEKKRIKQIFKASGVNLAQMAKPTSPSTLHGEKYMNEDQKHWYNFVFEILGRTDNVFRIPTFVDALARIASKNANNNKALADKKFTEYLQLNNKDEEAQIARKQALAVANMAVFTQDGTLASALNHIRSSLNTLSRGLLGLDPNGFGLGNLLAPFLKTGANVVEMGASAAIAPIRTIAIGLKKAQGKEIPELTKLALRTNWMYFTLTAAAAALLAAITSDDDEWYTEPYQPGFQYDPEKPYDSIKLMGVWVKLDVFGPFAIPMRTAAKIIKNWEEEQFAAIASGYGFGVMEALGDTPLADQLTSNTLEYAARSPDKWAETFAYNQINKFIPAQAKTATKAISRGMGADIQDYTKWAGPTLQRKFHRNYGLDGQALTTNDLIMLLTNRLKIDQGQ